MHRLRKGVVLSEISIPSPHGPIPATLEEVSSRVWILSHGIFVDRRENGRFERLSAELNSLRVSSIAPDLPGHGKNPISSVDTTLSRMVWSLVDTVEWASERYNRVGLVASSFSGAITSLAWPLIRDSINDTLVFLNPVLDFTDTFIDPTRPEMADMFNPESLHQAQMQGYFYPVGHFAMSRDLLFDFRSVSIPRAYGNLEYPHTIFHGDADELVPFDTTKRIAEKNKFCTWRTVTGGVHAFTQSGHEDAVWSEIIDLA